MVLHVTHRKQVGVLKTYLAIRRVLWILAHAKSNELDDHGPMIKSWWRQSCERPHLGVIHRGWYSFKRGVTSVWDSNRSWPSLSVCLYKWIYTCIYLRITINFTEWPSKTQRLLDKTVGTPKISAQQSNNQAEIIDRRSRVQSTSPLQRLFTCVWLCQLRCVNQPISTGTGQVCAAPFYGQRAGRPAVIFYRRTIEGVTWHFWPTRPSGQLIACEKQAGAMWPDESVVLDRAQVETVNGQPFR